ncbi:MAG: hypothetical protein HC834_00080 [Rhodospirillales bacterium]|nr:hypothetical protein [Rhodospirillales bacterium]
MPGVSAVTQVMAFDLAGIAISAGSACSSGKVAGSHVLAAMGVGEDLAVNAIRISLGWTTTADDANTFITAWKNVYRRSHFATRSREPQDTIATIAKPAISCQGKAVNKVTP